MTVRNFLKLHEGGVACVSIQQEPYDHEKHGYVKTYFEEAAQEDILASDTFKKIANKQVDHFNIMAVECIKSSCAFIWRKNNGE